MDYYLVDNPLTPDPTDFRGVALTRGSKTRDDIVKAIAQDNVGISESELKAVFEAEKKIVSQFAEEGFSISTELYSLSPKIRGVFNDIRETYTPGKHELRFNFTPSKILREVAQRVILRKIAPVVNEPQITVVEDVVSSTNNERITPGKSVRIFGNKLAFDAQDTEQGVFFINDKNKATRATEYIELGGKRIYAGVPDGLTAGDYTLQVRTKTQAGETRSGQLSAPLVVA